jgi:hypothetical protein
MSNYENIVEEFNKRNCKLLNTKEEYIEILRLSKKHMYKLNYTASCGHDHIVFYNVFKSRGTGIMCPACKSKENGNMMKEKLNNTEISKTYTIEQENNFIMSLCELLHNEFEIIKAFDGCNVDIIFKPKHIAEDKWCGIQVKTSNHRDLTYSFHLKNIYKNCLLLFYSCKDENMWLIPENIIINQTNVSIGYNKSKYNIYKVAKDIISDKLTNYYHSTSKFSFEQLDTPSNIYQQREKEFRKYREEKIDFIKFEYENREGTVYDFKIGNLKIQEKVTKMSEKNKCSFQLCKNNGKIDKKQNQIQYDIGDNDFYWLNCDDKKTFFVIPEKILIDRGVIGNNTIISKRCVKVSVKDVLHKLSEWLQPYMFDYDNINKERLLSILHTM